jgi:hypothetical protein
VDARVALLLEELQHFGLVEVVRHRHREGDDEPRISRCGGAITQLRGDALGGVAAHRLAAAPAVKARGTRVQQLQVVVELGHRPDRRAGRAHRVGLVDGDRGRDALDAIHLRLVHAVEELPRVGGERLDVAPLALGVDRVEHQRGLARARHAGDHHQLAQRNVDVESAQVVLAGPADADEVVRARGHRTGGVNSATGAPQ